MFRATYIQLGGPGGIARRLSVPHSLRSEQADTPAERTTSCRPTLFNILAFVVVFALIQYGVYALVSYLLETGAW